MEVGSPRGAHHRRITQGGFAWLTREKPNIETINRRRGEMPRSSEHGMRDGKIAIYTGECKNQSNVRDFSCTIDSLIP